MIVFDPRTINDWQKRHIESVSIIFVESGCEGTAVQVDEEQNPNLTGFVEVHGIRVYFDPSRLEILQNSRITRGDGRWIFKSDAILTRCGCGRSFRIKSGNIREDRLQLLRSKLKKSKIHTQ